MRWLDSIIDSMDMNLSKLQEIVGFPDSSGGKESAHNAGDPGPIPRSARSPGEGIGCPLLYSGHENSMDCIICGVRKSQTLLSDFHFHFQEDSGGQRNLASYSPWGPKESNMT